MRARGLLARPRMLAVAVALVVPCAGARGADVPGNLTLPLPTATQSRPLSQVEGTYGWYLRGDVGYRFQRIGSAFSSDTAVVPAPAASKLDNDFMGGYGIGYQWSWLRLDLTGDYGGRSKYAGTTASGTTLTGQVETFTALLNGYVDLGTWAGLTPYVGAGIGGAHTIFSNYANPAAVAPMPASAAPEHRWNLAWAATGGVSYIIARDLLVDVSYRHIDMGDVRGGPVGDLSLKHFTGDEVRVGFRYVLD